MLRDSEKKSSSKQMRNIRFVDKPTGISRGKQVEGLFPIDIESCQATAKPAPPLPPPPPNSQLLLRIPDDCIIDSSPRTDAQYHAPPTRPYAFIGP